MTRSQRKLCARERLAAAVIVVVVVGRSRFCSIQDLISLLNPETETDTVVNHQFSELRAVGEKCRRHQLSSSREEQRALPSRRLQPS